MPNLRNESERARSVTGHPLYKNERQALIQIAKTWPGHRGVNFATTTSENIYLLIMDSLGSAGASPAVLRASRSTHLGTNGDKASDRARAGARARAGGKDAH